MKLKLKMTIKNFSSNKEMHNFSNYLAKSKYYDNSNKLIIGKMKDETRSDSRICLIEAKNVFLLGRQDKIVKIKKQKA